MTDECTVERVVRIRSDWTFLWIEAFTTLRFALDDADLAWKEMRVHVDLDSFRESWDKERKRLGRKDRRPGTRRPSEVTMLEHSTPLAIVSCLFRVRVGRVSSPSSRRYL